MKIGNKVDSYLRLKLFNFSLNTGMPQFIRTKVDFLAIRCLINKKEYPLSIMILITKSIKIINTYVIIE